MSNLFDIVGGEVKINPDLLAIPCFNKLWSNDKSKNKIDSNNYFRYIILKNYHQSPYVLSMNNTDIGPRLRKEIFNDQNYKLPKEVIQCEEDFNGFLYTRTLRMLDNMRKKLDSISSYYEESLDECLDEKKIKDLLAGMEKVKGTYQTLDYLEKAVKTEELNNSKIRGGGELNPYEIPT